MPITPSVCTLLTVACDWYAGAGKEAEVVLFPGTKLEVVDTVDMGNGLFQVHLR